MIGPLPLLICDKTNSNSNINPYPITLIINITTSIQDQVRLEIMATHSHGIPNIVPNRDRDQIHGIRTMTVTKTHPAI
ncbi:hypothetical protein BGZ83_007278, partial [Gryganskiella cystojenkinii]